MPTDKLAKEFYEVSKLSKYEFEPYWPAKKLKICVTGAGGFIASHLAKRLKSEGHYIIGCDWKRNEHMPVYALSCLRCLPDHRWLAVEHTEHMFRDWCRKTCSVMSFTW